MNPTLLKRPAMSKHLIGPQLKQQRKVLAQILHKDESKPKRAVDPVSSFTWSAIFLIGFIGVLLVIYHLRHP
ncbi:hypothetical protein EXU85_20560 [Spirosoma sp. KCTC 42546]|uniref:hypothetical protein n=1 Tax=Spirosoma sp. KCTC 42546 TaxID=2520506 RepID=UPI001156E7A7|nr:hypothetical protein [Spirosoma sp. KCTC 42546]QDK80873.1 hypothetical protein EXU85_20560 [Spirosoma sp. KCTC 42546]